MEGNALDQPNNGTCSSSFGNFSVDLTEAIDKLREKFIFYLCENLTQSAQKVGVLEKPFPAGAKPTLARETNP